MESEGGKRIAGLPLPVRVSVVGQRPYRGSKWDGGHCSQRTELNGVEGR